MHGRTHRTCEFCGAPFTPTNHPGAKQRYCRPRCREIAMQRRQDARRGTLPGRRAYKAAKAREWRERQRLAGRCVRCGGANPDAGHTQTCHECSHGRWRRAYRIARGR